MTWNCLVKRGVHNGRLFNRYWSYVRYKCRRNRRCLSKDMWKENVKIEVLEFQRFDYEPLFKKKSFSSFANYHVDKLCELNFALARKFLGEVALALKKSYKNQIDFVASHGQTIYHIPVQKRCHQLFNWEPSVIAELTGLTVVADFRTRDMAAGRARCTTSLYGRLSAL